MIAEDAKRLAAQLDTVFEDETWRAPANKHFSPGATIYARRACIRKAMIALCGLLVGLGGVV